MEIMEIKRGFCGSKNMTKKYRSAAMAAIHETVESLYVVGAIDKRTMHKFDDACLTTNSGNRDEWQKLSTSPHPHNHAQKLA